MSVEKKDYVVVSTISQFRIRYAIHKDDLKNLNETPSDNELEALAKDIVGKEQCEEFSQHHLGEHVIDSTILSEEEMLRLFDTDNDYLSNWNREQKISWVRKNFKKEV